MKRAEMTNILKSELKHIPKGSRGSTQNKLRIYYNAWRRRDLPKGKSKEETLEEAVEMLKEDDPEFNPRFDREFFRTKGVFQRFVDWLKG